VNNRDARRSIPKRELSRRFYSDIAQIAELGDEGISPQAIASSLGLSEEFVKLVLETLEKEAEK
jgi:hypothetical protein